MNEVAKVPVPFAARYHKVAVPHSEYLTEKRIERLNSFDYEGPEARGALSVVKPSDRVLELGAGIGVVGAAVAVNCRPQRITSYEANPHLIPAIEELYALNGLNHIIRVRNRVLMSGPDRPETVTFNVSKNAYLGSSLGGEATRQPIPTTVGTDSWEAALTELAPTILIMDIEGAELDLLRHARLDGIRAVILEFHPGHYGKEGVRETKQILLDAGFVKDEEVSTRLVWTCTRTL